jgi:hypothetical protein
MKRHARRRPTRSSRQLALPRVEQLETRESPTNLLAAVSGAALAGASSLADEPLQSPDFGPGQLDADLLPATPSTAPDGGSTTSWKAAESSSAASSLLPVPGTEAGSTAQPPMLWGDGFFVGWPGNPAEDPVAGPFPQSPANPGPSVAGMSLPPGESGGGGAGGGTAGQAGSGAGSGTTAGGPTSDLPGGSPGAAAAPSAPSGAATGPAAPTSANPAPGAGNAVLGAVPTSSTSTTTTPAPRAAADFGKVPMQFEPNRGQTDPSVQFLARGPGYNLFLTANSAVMTLARPSTRTTHTVDVLGINFVGANAGARLQGQDELLTRSNYFRQGQQVVDVPNYQQVQVSSLYHGIDAVFYGNQQGKLEFDFVVAPGADPHAVQLGFQGVSAVATDPSGALLLTTASGQVVTHAPQVYQAVRGVQQRVSAQYVVGPGQHVGFAVGAYDPTSPLVIDPVLDYSGYLGGTGYDQGTAIAVDGAGNAYLTGTTFSPNFPTGSRSRAPTRGTVMPL